MAGDRPAVDNLYGRDSGDRSQLSAARRAELELADKIEAELTRKPLPRFSERVVPAYERWGNEE